MSSRMILSGFFVLFHGKGVAASIHVQMFRTQVKVRVHMDKVWKLIFQALSAKTATNSKHRNAVRLYRLYRLYGVESAKWKHP